jgi:hypothetical protein
MKTVVILYCIYDSSVESPVSLTAEAISGNQLLHDLQLFYEMKQEEIKQFIT